jgi:hypothetical protein
MNKQNYCYYVTNKIGGNTGNIHEMHQLALNDFY